MITQTQDCVICQQLLKTLLAWRIPKSHFHLLLMSPFEVAAFQHNCSLLVTTLIAMNIPRRSSQNYSCIYCESTKLSMQIFSYVTCLLTGSFSLAHKCKMESNENEHEQCTNDVAAQHSMRALFTLKHPICSQLRESPNARRLFSSLKQTLYAKMSLVFSVCHISVYHPFIH